MNYKTLSREEVIIKLKNIKPILEKQYGITKIGIFGSFARNDFTEHSDIDIVFETENPHGFLTVHLKEELEQYFNKHVDVVRYREKMNPYLKDRINSEAIYV